MADLTVSLDPCNPGQFYACCGIIELAELRGAATASTFKVDSHRPHRAEFILNSDPPVDCMTIASALKSASYDVFRRAVEEKAAQKDSIAPVRVSIFGREMVLDWWLDIFHEKANSKLKLWAGQVTTHKLVFELPKLLSTDAGAFDAHAYTSTRFGVDPRSAWVALDVGYSLNEQGEEAKTYPAVEMLAAFGLQGFRPSGSRSEGLKYSLWLEPLPAAVARAAASQPWDGLKAAKYQFFLGERGSYKVFRMAEPIVSRSDR